MPKPILIKKLEAVLRELGRESNFFELTDAQRYHARHLGHKIRDRCNGALHKKPNPGNYEPKQPYTEAQIKTVMDLAGRLGVPVNNPYLWLEAMTHSSYPRLHPGTKDNKRLEWLGDAILEIIVTEYLCKRYPNANAHELAILRQDLVSTRHFGKVAGQLELQRFLLTACKKFKSSDKPTLCDTFEALVAAIYLDSGLETAADFVGQHLFSDLPEMTGDAPVHRRSVEVFNNQAEAEYGILPTYKVEENKRMNWGGRGCRVSVYLGNELVAKAICFTQTRAKLRAAHRALLEKGWLKYLAIEDAKISADGNVRERKKKVRDDAGNYKPKCEREEQNPKGA